MGMASLLANTELKVEQLEYLATINNSGESLLNIINDILVLEGRSGKSAARFNFI
jgi:signal transduction histidine kinase